MDEFNNSGHLKQHNFVAAIISLNAACIDYVYELSNRNVVQEIIFTFEETERCT